MKRIDILVFLVLAFMLWNFLSEKKSSPGTSSSTSVAYTAGQKEGHDEVSKSSEVIKTHSDRLTSDLENQLEGLAADLEAEQLEKSDVNTPKGFENGIPEEFIPQELGRLGDTEKLSKDLEFRREKFERFSVAELNEFAAHHDVQGKDRATYQALAQKHENMRKELHQKHRDLLKEYRDKYKDENKTELR